MTINTMSNDNKPFRKTELEEFVSLTEEDIVDKFGEPEKREAIEEYVYLKYKNEERFSFINGKIEEMIVKSNSIEHIRSIKIGDTSESILGKFKVNQECTADIDIATNDGKANVYMKEYIYNNREGEDIISGRVIIQNGDVTQVDYIDGKCRIGIYF